MLTNSKTLPLRVRFSLALAIACAGVSCWAQTAENSRPAERKQAPRIELTIGEAPKLDLAERVRRAQELMRTQQAAQAYELLAEVEYEGAGDVEFDYLFGTAALDAGKPDKATLAFDRVLAVNPNHAGALVDKGRAHALLGQRDEARAHFLQALGLSPSAATRAKLEGFVAQLDRADSKWSRQAYLAATLGHDSNVNSSTDQRDVFVPVFDTTLPLSDRNVRTPDSFGMVSGGGEIAYGGDMGAGFFAGLDASVRKNADAGEFDLANIDVRVGPLWRSDSVQLKLSANLGRTYLDSDLNRRHTGLGAEMRYSLGNYDQVIAIGQYTRLRYADEETRVFDANHSLAGIGWLHAYDRLNNPIVFLGAYVGKEQDRNNNPFGGRNFYGLRLAGQIGLSPKSTLVVNLSGLASSYDVQNTVFRVERDDKRYDLTIGLNYQMKPDLLLRPQLWFTRQQSNVVIFDYERSEASLMLRRDFR